MYMQSKFMQKNNKIFLPFAPVATLSAAMRLQCRAIPLLSFSAASKQKLRKPLSPFTSLNCLSFSVFVFGVP